MGVTGWGQKEKEIRDRRKKKEGRKIREEERERERQADLSKWNETGAAWSEEFVTFALFRA